MGLKDYQSILYLLLLTVQDEKTCDSTIVKCLESNIV